jgi:hypothetical protein
MLGGNMNRILTRRSLALLAVALVSACGGNKPAPAGTSGEQKGQYGVSFYVSVSRPVGGYIYTDDRRIDCGTVSTGHDNCAPVSFAWTDDVALSAKADDGQYFQSWAGDCSGAVESGVGGCILNTDTYGADKWVVAVFNPPDQLGHSRIPNPSQHSPLFFKFIKSRYTPDPSAPQCTRCHGASYTGLARGVTPSAAIPPGSRTATSATASRRPPWDTAEMLWPILRYFPSPRLRRPATGATPKPSPRPASSTRPVAST